MLKIALIGNPNSGKTTLFNSLTGENQKIGNFTGVTVDKYTGHYTFEGQKYSITDFPGAYSLHPSSEDERIVLNVLLNPNDPDYPDVAVYVLDYKNLEQQLLLLTQIMDLGIPCILAITMSDELVRGEYEVNTDKLAEKLGIPVVLVSGKERVNLLSLKEYVLKADKPPSVAPLDLHDRSILEKASDSAFSTVASSEYGKLLMLQHSDKLIFLDRDQKESLQRTLIENEYATLKNQVNDTLRRFKEISPLADKVSRKKRAYRTWTDKMDAILTHRVVGPILFALLMMLVFQAIFEWATYPMDWIETGFSQLSIFIQNTFPESWVVDLLTEGIIAGIAGVVVFVPQIAILFFLIGLLEEIGYMSRAVYLFDRFMSRFGMNGRSIVAMISGGACAIPAIMSARTISDPKERLMTILVTPFIACSARIPVYIVLVAFVIPAGVYYGPFNGQALVFMGLYALGVIAALGSALLLRPIVGEPTNAFLMIELPDYKYPNFGNIWKNIKDKVTTFIWEAGKIILAISIVLWFLASYGPGNQMEVAQEKAKTEAIEKQLNDQQTENLIAAKQIEVSYAGKIGKWIEPAIEPLGFDWKIGIGLLSSFAAREVFIGTMATIYSIGDAEDELFINQRMKKEINPDTGKRRYDMATSLSLLLFFAFAMQCMSTVAVVKKETNSWKWPLFQFVFMTSLAYVSSFIVYQLFQ